MKIKSIFSRLVAHWPTKILALTAALILFVINRVGNLEERVIEVQTEVILPQGFVVSAPYQEKITLIIKGDRGEAVSKATADDYRVTVDLTQKTGAGRYTLPVNYNLRSGSLKSDIFVDKVEPGQMSVTIEQRGSKEVDVQADVKGAPRIGYVLTGAGISPDRVFISGPISQIEEINEIATEPISVSGKTDSFTTTSALLPPNPFITFDNAEFVEFQANIREERVEREFVNVPVTAINLGSAFVLENEEWKGSLTVAGPRIYLDDIDALLLNMTVDLSAIGGAGEFQMPVSASAPPRLAILDYQPREISILVRRAPREEE